jgi:hypothetical protein
VGQASIALGTTSDSYELRFPDELKVRTQVLAVGRDSSGTQVQIAYAIAGEGLEPVTVTQGFLYSVRVRFVATDRQGRVAATIDTTRHFVAPAPVPQGEHLVGRVSLPVPAGQFQYRLAIQQGEETGVVLPRDTVRVGQPTSTSLALSDLVIGNRNANLYWRRSQQDTVMFNPLMTFRRSEDMELYYEVEGLAEATPYTVKIAVRRQGGSGGVFRKIFGGGGAAISLKFDDQATFPVAANHRTLDLDRLKPGRYTLEVLVEDGQKRTDRRGADFEVVDGKGEDTEKQEEETKPPPPEVEAAKGQ